MSAQAADRWVHPRLGEDWKSGAACGGEDPELWFPTADPDGQRGASGRKITRIAKAICGSCDVRLACLGYAISIDARYGIWGGLTEREREKLTGRRRNWK